jgi:hypothetical protein
MHKHLTLILATLALSATAAFGQILTDGAFYAVGYAANLNIGDSVVNLSNSGEQGGFIGALPFKTEGNICVNVYAFDPAEEEISCCACLVTPNGVNSLSAKADLISNPLTPAIPTSIVIKLIASEPGLDKTGAFTICNPSNVTGTPNAPVVGVLPTAFFPYYASAALATGDPFVGHIAGGLLAWGTTLEQSATPGTYSAVSVPYMTTILSGSELAGLTSTCNFIQSDGSGFGICASCQTGALSGTKK